MTMSERDFKEGDEVYSPYVGNGLYRLVPHVSDTYPLKINYGVNFGTFTKRGLRSASDNLPAIFLATEENRLALETLYGVSFEPLPLKGSAKVRQLLKDNEGSRVLCVVSDSSEDEARYSLRVQVIHDVTRHHRPFQDQHGECWAYAVPLNEVDTGCLGVNADE